MRDVDRELVAEATDKLAEVLELVQASGLAADPAFRAYHLAQLEGHDGGWLGGPFLADALRVAATEEVVA